MKPFQLRGVSAVLAALTVGALAAGCSDDDDDDVFFPTDQGQLEVFIADAPPEFARLLQVNTTITRVEAIGAVTTGSATGLVVPLFTGSTTVDLLPLRGGQRQLIAQSPVPTGVYERIRVHFSDADVLYQTDAGSTTFSVDNGLLTITGFGQTIPGVAILDLELPDGGIQVDNGETEQVLIDIDVEESLDLQPDATNPSSMTLTLQGRARELADATTGGSIRGVVRSDGGTPANVGDDVVTNNAKVTLFDDGSNVVAVTRTDAQGVYVIDAVNAGQYQLQVESAGATTSQSDVNVAPNQQTTTDVLLAE